jgi:hypothetical protein
MKVLREKLSLLHRGLVACYPANVRRVFGEEMRSVFDEICEQANGPKALVLLLLRELRDWPIAIVDAHCDELLAGILRTRHENGEGTLAWRIEREVGMRTNDDIAPEEGRQDIWMAIPPLLLGLGVAVAALVRTDVWYRLPTWQLWTSVALTLLPGLIVGAGGLLALIRGVPDWGITWIGCGFMGFVLATQVMLGELVDEGTITLAPNVDTAIGLAFMLTGLVILVVLAMRGWARSGLFTMAAAATMGLSLLQSVTAAPINRDDLALLAGPLGLLFAILILIYIRKRGANRWFALLATAALNIGAIVIATSAWSGWRSPPELGAMVTALLVLMTGLLAAGPISGLLMRPILNRWA